MSKLTRKYGKKFVNFKALAVVTMAGIASLGATNSAQANEIPITPTLGDDASYTLKEVSTPTDNSITLYKYDNTGITEAINYEINLKPLDYGEGQNLKTFEIDVLDKSNNVNVKYDNATISNLNQTEHILNPENTTKDFPYELNGNFIVNNVVGNTVNPNSKEVYLNNSNISTIEATSGDRHINIYGGALFNSDNSVINADFVENSINVNALTSDHSTIYADVYGGAFYNSIDMDSFSGNFISNNITASSTRSGSYSYPFVYSYGGALANSGKIENLTANFVNNYISSSSMSISGGALYNSNYISTINGDFIGNYVSNTNIYSANGGALSNSGSIDSLNSNFIGNYATSTVDTFGGAICNDGTIGNITGDFIENHTYQTYSGSNADPTLGGAIYNSGKIGVISGDFIKNWAVALAGGAEGAAIYNCGTIDSIVANFYGNGLVYDTNLERNTSSSTIYNKGKIREIIGFFINNGASTIENRKGSIGAISGTFINNGSNVIYNFNKIGKITGSFVENRGEVIYNGMNGVIDEIDADFIDNKGRAIYNANKIGKISGNFICNIGAIENFGAEIDSISGNFIENSVSGDGYGSVIRNGYDSYIGSISGNFIRNSGSVISNSRSIDSINGFFDGNNTNKSGGAIYNTGNISQLSGTFINNYVQDGSTGGAIYSTGNINISDSLFQNNYVISDDSAYGGALFARGKTNDVNTTVGTLMYGDYQIVNEDGSIYKSFYVVTDGNSLLTEEQIKELIADGTVTNMQFIQTLKKISKSEFDAMLIENNMSEEDFYLLAAQQGMITTDPNTFLPVGDVTPTITQIFVDGVRANESDITLKNSNLIGNHADSTNGEAKGGAIYGEGSTIKFNADNGKTTLISGNYVKNGDVIENNAIYMNGGKLIFDSTNGSTIQLDDNVDGENDYETYIIGDEQSKFLLNNSIKNSKVNIVDVNVYTNTPDTLTSNPLLAVHSGTLNFAKLENKDYAFDTLANFGTINIDSVDVDMANSTMGRLSAENYSDMSGQINVKGLNFLSHSTAEKVEIPFADKEFASTVNYSGQKELLTPIFKYGVSYKQEDGMFHFVRGAGSSGSAAFNPTVLGSSTSANIGATGTMNQTFNYAFSNADSFMNIPYLERISMRDRNKYALSITGDATDMGRFSPLYQPSDESSSVWVKPYATFETVDLKNGPKVHNNTYGTLIGFDTEMKSIKRGWDRVWTGYIGYNGASQRYSGIDSTQNGGLLGGTMTLYKGNFFNATTVSVGASVANNQTMYGNEDFAMLLSGIGNKTGYNFEFKEGKLILQPSMLMSYTFVNTFDYTNAAGVRIDNKPLHALQLAPGVKVIGNLKGGWQPYASVSMVWNLMGESDARANGVKLPEMSIKPYVQYGVGVQKRIKDHFTAYGQAMVQNGGRNGVSLTAGFRWALGHDNCKYEKTQRHPEVKTEGSLTSNEILRSAQNDRGKSIRHCEEQSDVAIQSNGEILNQVQDDRGKYIDNKTSSLDVGGVMPRAAEHKKILKQMTPQQRAALGGKYYSTSRTAKSGSLRQY